MAEAKVNEKTIYEYSKVEVIARMCGLTARRIQQLTQDGILVTEEVKTSGRLSRRYHTEMTMQAYIKYLGRNQIMDAEAAEKLAFEKLKADTDFKRAKADMAQLELDELEGRLHSAEDIEEITTDLILNIRSMLMSLPGLLAVDMANTSDAQEASEIIKKVVSDMADELAECGYNRGEYEKRVRERKGWIEKKLKEAESEMDE